MERDLAGVPGRLFHAHAAGPAEDSVDDYGFGSDTGARDLPRVDEGNPVSEMASGFACGAGERTLRPGGARRHRNLAGLPEALTRIPDPGRDPALKLLFGPRRFRFIVLQRILISTP